MIPIITSVLFAVKTFPAEVFTYLLNELINHPKAMAKTILCESTYCLGAAPRAAVGFAFKVTSPAKVALAELMVITVAPLLLIALPVTVRSPPIVTLSEVSIVMAVPPSDARISFPVTFNFVATATTPVPSGVRVISPFDPSVSVMFPVVLFPVSRTRSKSPELEIFPDAPPFPTISSPVP